MANRFKGTNGYPEEQNGFKVTLHPDRINWPLTRWKNKSLKIFLCSMGDIFHKDVPFDFLERVFLMMCKATQHTFQVLTKRPERMKEFVDWFIETHNALCPFGMLPNHIWLGTSAENQKEADDRVPFLLNTPAAIRFLSCEPLLGPIDLQMIQRTPTGRIDALRGYHHVLRSLSPIGRIHQVIVGGESGHGARPMHTDWARKLRDQCIKAGTAYFFKQFGEWQEGSDGHKTDRNRYMLNDGTVLISHFDATEEQKNQWDKLNPIAICRVGKKKAGRLLDGQEWSQFPETKCQGGECSCSK
jgi:protein gp37